MFFGGVKYLLRRCFDVVRIHGPKLSLLGQAAGHDLGKQSILPKRMTNDDKSRTVFPPSCSPFLGRWPPISSSFFFSARASFLPALLHLLVNVKERNKFFHQEGLTCKQNEQKGPVVLV